MTPGAAQVVLTNGPAGGQPGIYYNLSPGERILIRQCCFGVNTVNDNCYFEFGYTDGPNGTGTFYPTTPRFYVATGAAPEGRITYDKTMSPPPCFKYADGARSYTARVDANDANCQITVAWHGWMEADI